jgi:hypothetical protein
MVAYKKSAEDGFRHPKTHASVIQKCRDDALTVQCSASGGNEQRAGSTRVHVLRTQYSTRKREGLTRYTAFIRDALRIQPDGGYCYLSSRQPWLAWYGGKDGGRNSITIDRYCWARKLLMVYCQ